MALNQIALIHPSKGRPQKSFDNAMQWLEKAGVDDIQLVISIDNDDKYFDEYMKQYEKADPQLNISIEWHDNKSVVEATNHAAKTANADIMIYLSDDFKCFDNWGALVLKEFEGEERPLLLKVHDNLQDFNARVLTIPMMNRLLYEKLNYFWHPEYKSMWVDCDLFETVNRIGALKNARHLVFPHEHHSVGKAENDETYKASEANWDQGLKVFNRRKAERFPI